LTGKTFSNGWRSKTMLNELKEILYSVQLVRQLLGGSWYLVADYNRDKAVWSTEPPDGYHVLDTEEWV
jgi:hypothetical protein